MKHVFSDRVQDALFDGFVVTNFVEMADHIRRNFTEVVGLFTFYLPEDEDWIGEGVGIIATCAPEMQKNYGFPPMILCPLAEPFRRELAAAITFNNYHEGSAILSHCVNHIMQAKELHAYNSNRNLLAFAAVAFNDARTTFYYSSSQ